MSSSSTAIQRAADRSRSRPRPPVPVAGAVLELIDRSRSCLLEACHATDMVERHRQAHLGALRAAAAVLAARGTASARSRPRSVWEVLPGVAPELGEWAGFFAANARRRAMFERTGTVPAQREADDLIRQAETFLGLVLESLGLPMRESLGSWVTPAAVAHPSASQPAVAEIDRSDLPPSYHQGRDATYPRSEY